MKDSIVVKELVRSVARGSKITLRSGTDFAEGYLLGVDEHDYLLGALTGLDENKQQIEPQVIILMVNRRGSVLSYRQECTYAAESEEIREVLDEYRVRFLEHFVDVVAEFADELEIC